MLLVASILTILVGLMHSVLGGRRLIRPILEMDGLPVILGDVGLSRLTLRIGWHLLTLMMWGVAGVLAYLHYRPETVGTAFLWMVCVVFGLGGAAAIVFSRGAHKSWVMFLPVAVITGYMAYTG